MSLVKNSGQNVILMSVMKAYKDQLHALGVHTSDQYTYKLKCDPVLIPSVVTRLLVVFLKKYRLRGFSDLSQA